MKEKLSFIDSWRSVSHANSASSSPESGCFYALVPKIVLAQKMLSMHRKNIRALSLIVCTLTYLMIGAAVFDALESETDMKKRALVDTVKNKMQAKYNFSDNDFRVLETVVVKSIPHKAGLQWKFAGAFYFATVVITMVGYGHSTPATRIGKAFCMFYALAGIPLNVVMFQSIGERLNTFISYILIKVKKCLKLKKQDVSQTQMIMVSGTLGTIVMLLGTYLFHKYEQWSLFESFYYCFITLTTIGFGDYVAIQKNGALHNRTEYIVFSLLFILFGLAIFSAAVNLFVLRFMATNADSDANDALPRASILLRGISDEDLADTPDGSLPDAGHPAEQNRPTDIDQGQNKNHTAHREDELEDTNVETSSTEEERYQMCWTSCCLRHRGRKNFVGSTRRSEDFLGPPRKLQHYTVRRSPVPVGHLVSIHRFAQAAAAEDVRNGPCRDMTVSTV